MRHIFAIILTFGFVSCLAQSPPITTTKLVATRQITIPLDTLTMVPANAGSLAFKNNVLYQYNGAASGTKQWLPAISYNATGLITAGSNVTITGSGTIASPYVINSTGGGGGGGSVTSVSVTTANGVSGSVANATTTPAITVTLGAITPTSVAASGTVTGSNLSGTNTGDQTTVTGNAGSATILQNGRTIAITGDLVYTSPSFNGSSNVTAAGTLSTTTVTPGSYTNTNITVDSKGRITAASSGSGGSTPNLDNVLAQDSISNHAIFLNSLKTPTLPLAWVFGDSETAGYLLPDPTTQAWPAVLGTRLGTTITNNAVSGWTLQTIGGFGTGSMEANLNMIPTRTPATDRFLIFAFGVNDHRWMNGGFSAATFTTVYKKVTDTAKARGWTGRIVLVKPFYVQNKTYKNDSASYSFASASSQARNIIFGDSISALSAREGLKVIDGYNAVASNGGANLIQADSLHLDEFGNIAVANEAAFVLDTVKQGTQKLGVGGYIQAKGLTLKSLNSNGTIPIGLDVYGNVATIRSPRFKDLTVIGNSTAGQLFIKNGSAVFPSTGNYYTMAYDEGAQYGVLSTSPSAGLSGVQYLQLYGGKTVIGGGGNPANGSKLHVDGTSSFQGSLFSASGSPALPTGNGFAIFPVAGEYYLYSTDAGCINLGFSSSPVTIGGSGYDGLHKVAVKFNAKFFEPVGMGVNSSVDTRLNLGRSTNLIVPLRFEPANVTTTAPLNGAMEFDSSYYYLSALGVRDTISTRAWARSVFSSGGGGTTNLGYTQNALNNIVNSSTGTGATFLPATSSLAGLLDTARAKFIDSARNRQIVDSSAFPLTATFIAYGNSSNELAGESAFSYNSSTNVFAADTANFKQFYNVGSTYASGGVTTIVKNTTTNKIENIVGGMVDLVDGGTLEYGKDYQYAGTIGSCTVPAVSANFKGRHFMITIKNVGSGILTINTPGSVNSLYNAEATNSYVLAIGEAIVLMPGNGYILIE